MGIKNLGVGGREKAIQEYINPKRKSLMSKAKKCLVRNTEGGCALFLTGRMLTAKPMPYLSQNLYLRNKMVVTKMYRNKFQLISKNFKIFMKVQHNHNTQIRSFVTI